MTLAAQRKYLFGLPPLPKPARKNAATTGARTLQVPLSGDRDAIVDPDKKEDSPNVQKS
jgi:hypothetical protein